MPPKCIIPRFIGSKTCLDCGSAYGTADQDCMPESDDTPVLWSRYDKCPDSGIREMPSGSECHCCEVTRRNSCDLMKVDELRAARKQSKVLDDKCREVRRQVARGEVVGTSKKRYPKIDVKYYLRKVEEDLCI